jgi:glycosyltransferase involved in cell wall biosynthesis
MTNSEGHSESGMRQETGKRRAALLVGNFTSQWEGGSAVCEGLAVRLEERGWKILTTSGKKERVARLEDMLSTTWRRRREYDVVYLDVYSGTAFFWAEAVSILARLLRKPYVAVLRGGGLPGFARHSARVWEVLNGAAAIVAPSGFLAASFSRHRDRLRIIPNCIEVSSYPFRERGHPAPHLIWLRSYHSIYNPWLAVEVVAEMAADNPDVRLTMVGPDMGDGTLESVRELATHLGVQERVTFLGMVPKRDVPGHLSEHDIFLNTTDVDNTPVSVIEAMACGLCVVSTNVGGLPYLLEDGRDSLMVPARSLTAMTSAVRRVLGSPELAATISRGGRRKAEGFDWDAVVPMWEALLQGSSEGGRRGGRKAW